MKVKNIMFAGFAAAIFASTAHAAATYTLASKDYVDTVKAGYVEANNLMQQQIAGIDAAYKAADGQTLEAAKKYADDIVAGEGGISEQVQQNTADIATINASDVMKSGITAAKLAELEAKQGALDEDQLKAVNSGITTEKVAAYDAYATTKQDTLTGAQVAAVNSGIDATKVAQIETNKTDIATINASDVMKSGITAAGVTQITTNKTNIETNAQNIQYLTEKTAAYVGPQTEGDYIIRYGKDGNVESLVQITVVDKDGIVMYPVATTPAN